MNTKNVLVVTLTSLAVGAALGILFAPDKGSSLRKKITRKGEGLIGNLKEKFDDFICEIKEQIDSAKDDAEELVGTAKSKAKEVKNDVNAALS